MTPGQEALAEAMRLEQARIYGQTSPEHRPHLCPQVPLRSVAAPVDIEAARLRRKGVA